MGNEALLFDRTKRLTAEKRNDRSSLPDSGRSFLIVVNHHTIGEGDEAGLFPQEMSVLVTDDDSIALEHVEIILSQVGISREKAKSGWEGIVGMWEVI